MAKYIFFGTLLAGCIFQAVFIKTCAYIDADMWSGQARYVEIGDLAQFNAVSAYGHPGGPVIIGVIAVHKLFHVSYYDALTIFFILFNALISACICVLCYLLNKESLWWCIAFGLLTFNKLYIYLTPPSVCVTLFISLLCLFTLYIYKKEKIFPRHILLWGLISGLAISSRFDIGSVMSFVFFVLLFRKIGWKHILLIALTVLGVFFLSDPFMWFMPIRHIADIFGKIFYHYENYIMPDPLSFARIAGVSFISWISILLALALICLKKTLPDFVPKSFLYIILPATALLYGIFLTSRYQTERYFVPLLFIWEIFLPVFVFNLFPRTMLKNPKTIRDIGIKTAGIITVIFMFIMFI